MSPTRNKARIHFSERKGGLLWETACGRFEVTATQQIELVTCKRCLQRLHKSPVELIAEVIVPAFQDIEPLSCPESGLPILRRDTYLKRHCKCGSKGCDICRHFKAIETHQQLAPWSDRPQLHLQRRYRWGSARQAVEWYLMTERNGAHQPSMGEALLRLGRIGARVQDGGARELTAYSESDDRVTVSKAIERADTEADGIAAMVGLLDGIPLSDLAERLSISPKAAKSLFRRTLGRVGHELAKRDAIPPIRGAQCQTAMAT